MPNISNVQLQIQKRPTPHTPTASRSVTVTYQLGFAQAEVDARAAFQVRVSLLSIDNTVLPLTAFTATATSGTLSKTETKVFQRRQLDEEIDSEIWFDPLGHPHRIPIEMPDSWRARVAVTYLPEPVFGNAMGISSSVVGSWGTLGND